MATDSNIIIIVLTVREKHLKVTFVEKTPAVPETENRYELQFFDPISIFSLQRGVQHQ